MADCEISKRAAPPSDAVTSNFFQVHVNSSGVETTGQTTAKYGHQLPSSIHGRPDGIFARWHWDGARLVVDNDRYGFFPMFWSRTPSGGVCISPSLVTLIKQGASTELDVEALAVFFRLGFFLGDDTPFAAIKVVPPDAVFEWQDGILECRGRYPAPARPLDVSRDEAIDRYIDLFAKAMAKRAPASNDFAIPVSGGRDSRHILLELHRMGFNPRACVTAMDNPPDPNEDPRVAAILCEALGFRHVVVDQQLSIFAAQLRKNVETHFCASAHGWYLALADFLNHRTPCTYDGIAGDVLSQSKFLSAELDAAFRSGNVDTACSALLSRQASSYSGVRDLLKGELKACLDPHVAKARLSRELTRHLDAPNPVGSFIFWNRTRREIALAPYGMLTGVPNVYAPFLDHELFDFLSTLPSSMVMDHRFHDDTIVRAYPAFANIPYVDPAAPTPDDAAERARFLVESARRFLPKRPSRLMKNLRPRAKMLAGFLSGGRIRPWVSPFIIYLDQLESMRDVHHSVSV
ncbi:MAG TPA: hypothetical protein VJL61_08750 [Rhodanobacteraceae bacterium]|nr:hypothetical protein [Rhodanobacteraceae bacterium]